MELKPKNEAESKIVFDLKCGLGITGKRYKDILNQYGSLEAAIDDKLNSVKKKWWKGDLDWSSIQVEAEIIRNQCVEYDISFVTIYDDTYPRHFRDLIDPPLVIFYKGDIRIVSSNIWITVVGSRIMLPGSQIAMRRILPDLLMHNIGVVSGLAVGVDASAHKLALENNALTVAIIGSGLEKSHIYPAENYTLHKEIIAAGGVVMSEYPPLTKPDRYTFPQRNRLLAALGKITWVVQAGLRSGSLQTAQHAKDLNKEVVTIPGDILTYQMQGNNQLLKQGSRIVLTSDDVFEAMNIAHTAQPIKRRSITTISEHENILLSQLMSPKHIEDISRESHIPLSEVMMLISKLELIGLVQSCGDNEWVAV